MIYHFKSLVLVRKGRAFYATLYQEVFFANPGGGGSLRCYFQQVEDEFYNHFFIIDAIAINNDSTLRALLKHLSIGVRGQVLKLSKVKLDE